MALIQRQNHQLLAMRRKRQHPRQRNRNRHKHLCQCQLLLIGQQKLQLNKMPFHPLAHWQGLAAQLARWANQDLLVVALAVWAVLTFQVAALAALLAALIRPLKAALASMAVKCGAQLLAP